MSFDDDRPAVQNSDLCERIAGLMKPEKLPDVRHPHGSQYAPGESGRFVMVLKYLGIFDACQSIEFRDQGELPPGATPWVLQGGFGAA